VVGASEWERAVGQIIFRSETVLRMARLNGIMQTALVRRAIMARAHGRIGDSIRALHRKDLFCGVQATSQLVQIRGVSRKRFIGPGGAMKSCGVRSLEKKKKGDCRK